MAWYWIVLIILGYFVVMGACLEIMMVIEDDDDPEFLNIILCLFWPVTIPSAAVALIPAGIAFLIKDKFIRKNKR